MSADRFQFLEFEEEEQSSSRQERVVEPEPTPRDIEAERLADGTALAEVRIRDPRGYLSFQEAAVEGEITLSSLAVPAEESPTKLQAVEIFGERGERAGQFQYPTGVAVDRAGILFVADTYNHRIQRITPGGGVSNIGVRGNGRGQFLSPQGIATDSEDSFYIVEQGNARVQKFTREGVLELVFGRPGRGEGELSGPTAIAVAPGSGDIFVADTGNSRIQRYDYAGRFLSVIGAPGGYGASLSSPQALAIEAGGGLIVADTFAQRLIRYDPLGRWDRQLGVQKMRGGIRNGAASLSFQQPRGLALDPAGLLYIADGGPPDSITGEMRGRVQCLSLSDWRLRASVDKIGRAAGALLRPGGLAVGPHLEAEGPRPLRGDLYVADTMNHRVLRFVWR